MTGSRHSGTYGGMDWWAIGAFFLLMVLGWVNIYAAVYDEAGAEGFRLASRYGSQLIWMGVCIVVAGVILLIDDIYYHILAYPAYFFMILVLLATMFIGVEVNGAKAWLRFGGFSIQPAEFAKFTTALALARYMSWYHFNLSNWKNLLAVAGIIGLPMLIIVLQNDTGSAVIYMAFLIVLFREGLNPWVYVALGFIIYLFVFSFIVTPEALLASVIIICTIIEVVLNGGWKQSVAYLAGIALVSLTVYIGLNLISSAEIGYYWVLLGTSVASVAVVAVYAYKEKLKNVIICIGLFVGSLIFIGAVDYIFDEMLQVHQQKRILNLLGVESDLHKWGYNVNQSKIAIGSGGLFGAGFLNGTQTKYDFVPEQSTDFIFSTVGEEWGFMGSTIVLLLFLFLIARLVIMGERQNETFGRVYCYSVASIFFTHVIVNVGMTIGVMPVIGIPLPMFSYGGSSLLAFTILFFVAVKLDSRKRESFEYNPKR